MSRSLFDPSRMAGTRHSGEAPAPPPAAPGQTPPPPLTVTQLAALIDATLRDHLERRLRVVGEVSGFNDRTHWYFSLKDAEAVVSCVMFASAARTLRFRPENGHEVVATGRVEFFAKQGRTQFYVEKLEPVGAGALDLEFKRLCDELKALGWFAPERKRPLPRFPRRICVITSKTSAAYQDVLDTMRRRAPGVQVALVDVRVQGPGAAAQVARAIQRAGSLHRKLSLDALLVTRGGGSKEDLWTFNERVVAEAIVHCPIPVVAAIGHETDVTIAELVADERCATPTQAAMRLTPDTRAQFEQLDASAVRLRFGLVRRIKADGDRLHDRARHLRRALREQMGSAAYRLERSAAGIERHRPATLYARREAALADLRARLIGSMRAALGTIDVEAPSDWLQRGMAALLDTGAGRLESHHRALELVGPSSVLARGYSATLRADGTAVRSVKDVAPGDRVRTLVNDGSFESTVTPEGARPSPAPRRRKGGAAAGPSLFE